LLRVCWPPSIALVLLDRLVAQLLGGEHRAHLDPGRRAVGRERQDRLEGVRVAAGLTVQQRDPLRRAISVQEIHSW